ncbi:MAG TPA: NrfD/PsrC family molybdoenzyme membrane anchor subunit, partial [Coriobacteriia bacterium]|nr:NrfD/PsrC family molybdoenzyme membrane anchor subunit [Coriobacteriia bacterium]
AMRMTLIALPFAVYLHTTTAFVLVMNKSRELWNTAMLVPIFLTSATASGIALLMICAYILQHFNILKFKSSMFRSLATLLGTVIIIDLFLLVVEMLVVYWPTSAKPGHTIRFDEFLTGGYSWAFLPVLLLGITAFTLLARTKTRHLPAVQLTAAAMYVVAIFLKRYVLMSMGFAINPLGTYTPPYFPSLVETLIAIMLLSLGLLIMTIGAKVLPLAVPENEYEHETIHVEPAAEPVLEAG